MTDSLKIPPPLWESPPVPAHPYGRHSTIPSQCIPASPSISGLTVLVIPGPDGLGRERAGPAAVEHSGQMWKVHFTAASHEEAAELEACT